LKFISEIPEGKTQDSIISRFINPGEFFFCESNCQIHTILGSCIAITLWHPTLKIGGMCHFVLPGSSAANKIALPDPKLNGRYSDEAMALFEREIIRRGTNFKEYQAKIFGGSNMLVNSTLLENELIGTKNSVAAKNHLSERDVPILVAHIGETGYRRITFDVATGDVWVKHELL